MAYRWANIHGPCYWHLPQLLAGCPFRKLPELAFKFPISIALHFGQTFKVRDASLGGKPNCFSSFRSRPQNFNLAVNFHVLFVASSHCSTSLMDQLHLYDFWWCCCHLSVGLVNTREFYQCYLHQIPFQSQACKLSCRTLLFTQSSLSTTSP